MNKNEMLNTHHVTLEQIVEDLGCGITSDAFLSWAYKNREKLLKTGFVIEQKGKRRTYSTSIVSEFVSRYDKGLNYSEQLDAALDLVVDDYYRSDSTCFETEEEREDALKHCEYICKSNAIKSIEVIDRELTNFNFFIKGNIVKHLVNDVRAILFRMTSIAHRDILETYNREILETYNREEEYN